MPGNRRAGRSLKQGAGKFYSGGGFYPCDGLSVPALIAAIEDYIDHHNDADKGFLWTAKAEDILAKVRRARAVLDKTPSV